ncbi:MmcQ/YjbR family DNA-binding protein [Enterococcus sp. DIV1298c]|uniref:MmcQ/YjbR family DNA-binding protein n=1 Tax=Enterococcus sp. DIV1298c TaxID=2815328 RepID=UPI001A914268|nr:MmcQ/YjbR family DNA-binding protein [Enterococcus sp. DIV1298c]MBO0460245.1 MmcQ/YjbR family DNA-binding protein [Enterococcus sp. DIV1298c]
MNTLDIQKRIERFQEYGRSLPAAKVYFREDWETLYFDLLGKQFGMMSPEANEKALITLKHFPEKNEELRTLYPEIIIPGYYANKKHWNSIMLAKDELSDEEIEKMILISYELVLAKFSKKQQEEIKHSVIEED